MNGAANGYPLDRIFRQDLKHECDHIGKGYNVGSLHAAVAEIKAALM